MHTIALGIVTLTKVIGMTMMKIESCYLYSFLYFFMLCLVVCVFVIFVSSPNRKQEMNYSFFVIVRLCLSELCIWQVQKYCRRNRSMIFEEIVIAIVDILLDFLRVQF